MHYERTAREEETVADLFAATIPALLLASLALVCDCTGFSKWEILTALH